MCWSNIMQLSCQFNSTKDFHKGSSYTFWVIQIFFVQFNHVRQWYFDRACNRFILYMKTILRKIQSSTNNGLMGKGTPNPQVENHALLNFLNAPISVPLNTFQTGCISLYNINIAQLPFRKINKYPHTSVCMVYMKSRWTLLNENQLHGQ